MIWGMFMSVTLEISSIHGKELHAHLSFHHEYERSQEVQKLWQNWRWANGVRVQYFPRIQYVAAQSRDWVRHQRISQEELYSCRCSSTSPVDQKDNEKEYESNTQLVSQDAKRFESGRWSFLGLGSEKKWYSFNADSPQGELDRVAELMMIKFGESGHPVFRATSSLSRGTLQSKGGGNLSIHFCGDGETIELFFAQIFLLIISVFTEQSQKCVKNTKPFTIVRGNPLWQDNRVPYSCKDWSRQKCLWIVITVPTKIFLMQQSRERIEKLSQRDRLSKFCMVGGFLNVVEIGQYFMTKDTAEFSQFTDAVACREYTLPREEEASEPKGWIRENTKIGPVLEVATCCLHCKYGVEIRITSMNEDNSHSWVRISHGSSTLLTNLNNSEQETSEVQLEEYALKLNASDFACRSKAKAKPQRREPADSSTRAIRIGGRTWTDVEPGEYSLSDRAVSKKLIHLLRHWKPTSRKRRSDWILENQRPSSKIIPALSSLVWRQVEESHGRTRRKQEKIPVLYWFIRKILYLRALQVHSGRSLIDPSLQDNAIILDGFFKYIYHVGCAINLHSIINSGLIPGGQYLSNIQTVFFLPVDLMDKNHKDPDTIDLNATRHAQYMHKAWKRHQNTVYWVDINLVIAKGLKFYQTRSNAIILFETLPAYCIPKVVRMVTGQAIFEKVFASTRPPPKISLKMIGWKKWVQKLLNDQRDKLCNHLKVPNRTNQFQTPIVIERGNPLLEPIERENPLLELTQEPRKMKEKTSRSQEIETRSFHDEAVNQERTGQPVVETGATQTRSSDDSKSFNVEDKVAHDRTGRPFVSCHTSNVPDGSQTRSSHESTSFNVGDDTICDRTGQPVVNRDETGHEQTMLNEVNMDFRIPGLPHSAVKQAESSRVRQLVKKIQNHPDRHALQLDLQQNKSKNPLSTTSKQLLWTWAT